MSQQSNTGPVGGLLGVGIGGAILDQSVDEFVNQMRMRTTVPRALGERQMLIGIGVINTLGSEMLNRLRQQVGEIWALHMLRNFRLRLFRRMHDQWFALINSLFLALFMCKHV